MNRVHLKYTYINWMYFRSWYGWGISSPSNISAKTHYCFQSLWGPVFLWVLTVFLAPRLLSSLNLTLHIQLKQSHNKPSYLSRQTAQKCWWCGALILLHFFGKNSQQFDCAVYFWSPSLPPKWHQIATRLHYFLYQLFGYLVLKSQVSSSMSSIIFVPWSLGRWLCYRCYH